MLAENGGNIPPTARQLGMHRRSLFKEITEKTCRGHARRLASTAAPWVDHNRRPPETGHPTHAKGR